MLFYLAVTPELNTGSAKLLKELRAKPFPAKGRSYKPTLRAKPKQSEASEIKQQYR